MLLKFKIRKSKPEGEWTEFEINLWEGDTLKSTDDLGIYMTVEACKGPSRIMYKIKRLVDSLYKRFGLKGTSTSIEHSANIDMARYDKWDRSLSREERNRIKSLDD